MDVVVLNVSYSVEAYSSFTNPKPVDFLKPNPYYVPSILKSTVLFVDETDCTSASASAVT